MRKSAWCLLAAALVAGLFLAGCGGSGPDVPAPGTELAPTQVNDHGSMRVLIGFTSTPGPAEANVVRAQGGRVLRSFHLVPAISAVIPERAKQALERNPTVEYVEGDPEAQASVYYGTWPAERVDWGIDRIDADLVWGTCDGTGVRVAVLDTGINGPAMGDSGDDPTGPHPDLECNIAGGINIVSGGEQARDDNGHGTHVAGTIGADDNYFGAIGAAPGVSLYSVKVLGADGSGYYSWIIDGLQWCVDNGIQIANMSLGGSRPSRSLQLACDNAYASGVLLVAASGNEGGRVNYPAKYDSVIAVSAINSDDSVASFSNTGREIELCAPGVSVFSTCDQWLDGSEHDMDGSQDGYGVLSGTSMASPHVAGTAALVIASGVTGPDAVRARLQETAEDLGPTGKDDAYGYGLVDAQAAAGPVNEAPTVVISSPADGSSFDSGATISFTGTATDPEDGDLTSSLVWTSDLDGQVGTGGSFSTTLSDGTHTIAASVTDSGGLTGTDSITITVGSQPPPGGMYVWDIAWSTKGPHLAVTVTVHADSDADGVAEATDEPVEGASVAMDLSLQDGGLWSFTGVTDSSGQVSFMHKRAASGEYTAAVTGISHDGYEYDAGLDADNPDSYSL